jgi:putative SOS response-associated peptidase YedK
MAGVWERWTAPDGVEVETFSILTTEANALVGRIHPRMPVILQREGESVWLNAATPADALLDLAAPLPAELMEGYPVTPAVNAPRYQGGDATERSPA